MDKAPLNPKYGFIESFERPEFTEQVEKIEKEKSRKQYKQACKLSPPQPNNKTGLAMAPWLKGGPSIQLLKNTI